MQVYDCLKVLKDVSLVFRFVKGFVVKTRTENGEKVFLNVCHTEEIPAPQDINDTQLIKIMQSDEPSSYRLPLSIGDLHEEPDKSKH